MSQSHRFIFKAPDPNPALNPLKVGSSDIAEWLLERDPRAIATFSDITAQEYARSFAVARTLNTDTINDLYYTLVDTFDKGGTVHDFRDQIMPTLKAKGWLQGDETKIASRLNLIFFTNANRAMAQFDYDKMIKNAALIPYRIAFTAEDERVRHPPKSASDHRAWDGIVLPATHPFWAKWGTRHIGFGCRCNSAGLTRSQFARRAETITSDEDLAQREARLGAPVFASPGAPVAAQVDAVTQRVNAEERMPGLPEISADDVIQQAEPLVETAKNAAQAQQALASIRAAGLPAPDRAPSRYARMTADEIAAELAQGDKTFAAGLRPETDATLAILRARRRLRGMR